MNISSEVLKEFSTDLGFRNFSASLRTRKEGIEKNIFLVEGILDLGRKGISRPKTSWSALDSSRKTRTVISGRSCTPFVTSTSFAGCGNVLEDGKLARSRTKVSHGRSWAGF